MQLHTKIWDFKVDVVEDNDLGLLARAPLGQKEALLMIFPHASFWPIHTMGLTYAIDVLWLDVDNMVVDKTTLVPDIPGVIPDLPARKILEMRVGMSRLAGIQLGDHLILSSNK